MNLAIKLIVLVATAGLFWVTAVHSHEAYKRPEGEVSEPPLINLSSRTIAMLFLGFKHIYDDFLSLWAVHYLASPDPTIYDLDALEKMLNKIATSRQRRETTYIFSCFVLSQLGRPQSCPPILELGMEVLPTSWRIPLTLGFIYTDDLNDPRKAAIYYNVCSEREYSPSYIKSVARKLAQRGGTTLEALDSSVAEVLGISEDSELYKVLKRKYKKEDEEKIENEKIENEKIENKNENEKIENEKIENIEDNEE